ncbi:MAG: hypothetical protein AAFW74_08335, partial [Pseudomonadota bacterium]
SMTAFACASNALNPVFSMVLPHLAHVCRREQHSNTNPHSKPAMAVKRRQSVLRPYHNGYFVRHAFDLNHVEPGPSRLL